MNKVCFHQGKRVKMEPLELNGKRTKKHCIACLRKEFAIIRWTTILCLQKMIPKIKDLHRLITGPIYMPLPWREVVYWSDWTYNSEFEEMYDLEDGPDYTDLSTSLVLKYVDRGVSDFKSFSNVLNQLFPNLKRLQWKQNYSVSTFNIFKAFVKHMKLEKLWIADWQTDFFDKNTHWKELFDVMPENSIYTFKLIDKRIKKTYEYGSKKIFIIQ